MKTIEIKGYKREGLGKKDAKKLRINEQVPAVLYGGDEPVHFFASAKEFTKLLHTPNVYIVDLNIDGTVHQAMVQDAQFHPVSDETVHVDFLKIHDDKPVKIEIPLKVEGFAKGIRKGGKLKVNLRRLKVKALPKHLPDTININVDDLDLGQSFKVSELEQENLEFLNAKSIPVVTIMITRAARAAKASAGK